MTSHEDHRVRLFCELFGSLPFQGNLVLRDDRRPRVVRQVAPHPSLVHREDQRNVGHQVGVKRRLGESLVAIRGQVRVHGHLTVCPKTDFAKLEETGNISGSSGSCVLRRNSLPRESFPTSSISLSIRGTCGGVGRAFSEQRGRVPSPRRGCRTVSIGRSHTRKPLTIAGKRTSSWSVGLCWRATRSNEGEGRVFRRESRPFRFTSLPFVLKTRPGGCRPSGPKYASVG